MEHLEIEERMQISLEKKKEIEQEIVSCAKKLFKDFNNFDVMERLVQQLLDAEKEYENDRNLWMNAI